MLLGIVSQTFGPAENHSWLGSQHGTTTCDSVTLNGDLFLTLFPTGVVPSGVVLGKITATGRYVPYSAAATDGSQVALGHLFTTIDLGGTTVAVTGDAPAAIYWHGEVVEAKLPVGHGLTAAAKTDLKQIRYV